MLEGSVEVTGLDELQKTLGTDLRRAIRAASMAIGEAIRGYLAVYPAQRASANPNHWYERGYGSKWRRKDGSVGARATSEQLGPSWGVETKDDGAVVGTRVSYAPYVQSEEEQTGWHQGTGWITEAQAVQKVEQSGVIQEIVADAVVKELNEGSQ